MESRRITTLGGPALSKELPADPRSASQARRIVASALAQGGHESLVDVATLLVSEVVTNAILHAGTPIRLHCSWTSSCVRIEVHDRSAVLPSIRHYDPEATTGRGLALVAELATGWGIETGRDGKNLWFELGAERGEAESRQITVPASPAVTVHLLDAPPALLLATIEYGDAILRELALLSVAGQPDDLLPGGWQLPQIDLGPILAAAEAARDAGCDRADLELELPEDVRDTSLERLRLIDHADSIARQDRLLIQPALPEIGACRHWLYSQIHEQCTGAAPQRWRLPEPLEPARVAAALSESEMASLRTTKVATVVADDANRVIYVNEAAAALLGWEPEELLGQRLTVIIPPELREAHLAGFSRLQMTGQSRLLGRPVDVPALRRDGDRVDVVLTIGTVEGGSGRRAFRASLEPRASRESLSST